RRDLDAALDEAVLEELEHVSHDARERDRLHLGLANAGEVEHASDDPRDALDLPRDDPKRALGGLVVRELPEQRLGAAADDVQRGADLVGEAGGEAADAREPLGLAELRLRAATLFLLGEERPSRRLEALAERGELPREAPELVV